MRFYSTIFMIAFVCVIATKSIPKHGKVTWNKQRNLWQADFYIKGQKQKSYFRNEVDATKKLNQLCDEITVPPQNVDINEIPNQQQKEKTSQYKTVSWNQKIGKWCAQICMNKKRMHCGYFNDELDAAKRVNQVCEDLGIPSKNPKISAMPNEQYQQKKRMSQYKGVTWHNRTKKWYAQLLVKGEKKKYGGTYNEELDAAKRVNQLCEELGIPSLNLKINAIPNQQYKKKEKTSQYKGVSWNKQIGKWCVLICPKGQIRKYGGVFNDELDAAKSVNQLCEQLRIPPQNPSINGTPIRQYQKKKKRSQYPGVYWHDPKGKWYVLITLNGGKKRYSGMFQDELDAARRVNQLCEDMEIPLNNPTISTISIQQCKKKENTSQYKGDHINNRHEKWYARVSLKGQKQIYGGCFNDELAAANRVNDLCEGLGNSQNNPIINSISNEQCQKYLLDHDDIQAEFEDLITILGEHNAPTSTIQKNLFAAINYGEQAIMREVNFCTKNGESALSIAAKHGFSNAVKFLISKGADKEHFTNEHHTPLSLAVSHNHLKVVQVLFEEWISPNSHEKTYLHLSPIFNVKSREIAQLLIENDAITHEIYNNKNQSPLTVACQNGYLDIVEFFLDDGLDINHLDSDNKNPLFYALTNKHHDVANLLISKGAQDVYHFKSY